MSHRRCCWTGGFGGGSVSISDMDTSMGTSGALTRIDRTGPASNSTSEVLDCRRRGGWAVERVGEAGPWCASKLPVPDPEGRTEAAESEPEHEPIRRQDPTSTPVGAAPRSSAAENLRRVLTSVLD